MSTPPPISSNTSGAATPLSGPTNWPVLIRLFHWATLLAVLSAVVLSVSRDWVDDDDLTDALLDWHRYAGMAVLALTLARLAIRLLSSAPDHQLQGLNRLASTAGHHLLYLMLLALPIVGWLTSNAHGVTLHIGPFVLPTLIGRDHDLGDTLGLLHKWAGWSFLGLVGLHAAAALWHHLFLKDGVLLSMLGRARRRG